ncbi:hypothetical protein ACR6C2_00335 [Streptomyces sp. INA 01156]
MSKEHAASYRAREVSGPTLVVDGVWSVPVPLHGSPLHSVIVYLIETPEGPVLIDAGYEHPTCWASFQEALERIGRSPESIRRCSSPTTTPTTSDSPTGSATSPARRS